MPNEMGTHEVIQTRAQMLHGPVHIQPQQDELCPHITTSEKYGQSHGEMLCPLLQEPAHDYTQQLLLQLLAKGPLPGHHLLLGTEAELEEHLPAQHVYLPLAVTAVAQCRLDQILLCTGQQQAALDYLQARPPDWQDSIQNHRSMATVLAAGLMIGTQQRKSMGKLGFEPACHQDWMVANLLTWIDA
ncbi:MAG: hypothetical protein FRX49_03233 [Trebouxia sp. A1-2]|nr:MAG: hypothetical protein FRX49_03233 [Trebouxia sp. A1-2]